MSDSFSHRVEAAVPEALDYLPYDWPQRQRAARALVERVLAAADQEVPMVPMLRDGNGWLDPYAKLRQFSRELDELCDKDDAKEAELARLRAVEAAAREILQAGNAGGCREWIDTAERYDICWAPAEFVLWGKLLKPDALGPRCYDHAAKHVGHRALGDPSWAIIDLRRLRSALSEPAAEGSGEA